MQKLGAMGLLFESSDIENNDDGVKFHLVCKGNLESIEDDIEKTLSTVPYVESIISIVIPTAHSDAILEDEITHFDNRTKKMKFQADEELTDDIIFLVEDRLSELLGPVANILLHKAVKKSKLVGELFLHLSDDLNDEQKKVFFNNVDGLEAFSFETVI